MVTITIKEDSTQAKAFIEFVKGLPFVQFVNTPSEEKSTDKSQYSPELVAKIKKAESNIKKGKTTRLNPDDVWGNIL